MSHVQPRSYLLCLMTNAYEHLKLLRHFGKTQIISIVYTVGSKI